MNKNGINKLFTQLAYYLSRHKNWTQRVNNIRQSVTTTKWSPPKKKSINERIQSLVRCMYRHCRSHFFLAIYNTKSRPCYIMYIAPSSFNIPLQLFIGASTQGTNNCAPLAMLTKRYHKSCSAFFYVRLTHTHTHNVRCVNTDIDTQFRRA